jgi:hypothetical protein
MLVCVFQAENSTDYPPGTIQFRGKNASHTSETANAHSVNTV